MLEMTDKEVIDFIAKNVAHIRSEKDDQLSVETVAGEKVDVVLDTSAYYDALKDAITLLKIKYYDG